MQSNLQLIAFLGMVVLGALLLGAFVWVGLLETLYRKYVVRGAKALHKFFVADYRSWAHWEYHLFVEDVEPFFSRVPDGLRAYYYYLLERARMALADLRCRIVGHDFELEQFDAENGYEAHRCKRCDATFEARY